MELHHLNKIGRRKAKRIGRGYGSGKGGHTVGRGQKGQTSRSGYKKFRSWVRESKIKSLPKLKGIGKRSAKRGYFKTKVREFVLNLKDLAKFKTGEIVDLDLLKKEKIVKAQSKKVKVKILGQGEIKQKLVIKGLLVSKSAKKKIEQAGGKIL